MAELFTRLFVRSDHESYFTPSFTIDAHLVLGEKGDGRKRARGNLESEPSTQI